MISVRSLSQIIFINQSFEKMLLIWIHCLRGSLSIQVRDAKVFLAKEYEYDMYNLLLAAAATATYYLLLQ
jgi:hypothetical protein